jgi:hypothetical protein
MKPHKNSEKGQIVVLLVLVVIGLLGFTALAIDGSMIYSDRRFTQSVADSASLAGGNAIKDVIIDGRIIDYNFYCPAVGTTDSTGTIIIDSIVDGFNASLARAYEYYPQLPNVVASPLDSSDLALDGSIYTIPNIDLAGNQFYVSCNESTNSLTMYVQLTSQTDTAFAHLISDQLMRNTVEAETLIKSQVSLTAGDTIISLSQECANKGGGITLHGGVEIVLENGGACSNSCLVAANAAMVVEVVVNDEGVNDGINYDINFPYNPNPIPDIDPYPSPIEDDCIDTTEFTALFDELEKRCSLLEERTQPEESSDGSFIFFEGRYVPPKKNQPVIQISNQDAFFHPGLYCIYGSVKEDAIQISGGSHTAEGVTFVIMGGDVQITGNPGDVFSTVRDDDNDGDGDTPAPTGFCTPSGDEVNLDGVCEEAGDSFEYYDPLDFQTDWASLWTISPFPSLPDVTLAEPGILFYVVPQPGGLLTNLNLIGTSDSTFSGIIYAPSTLVDLSGTAGLTTEFGLAVIGYDVRIGGTVNVTVSNYMDDVPFSSGWLDLLR